MRLLGVLLTAALLLVIFISPIARYLIERYDVPWTGRQIEMDGVGSLFTVPGSLLAPGIQETRPPTENWELKTENKIGFPGNYFPDSGLV